jgi:hypothetical protein
MAASETGLTKHELTELLKKLGELLDFDVRTEVEASESAWVDIVWFDKRLPPGEKSFKMRYAPVLPVISVKPTEKPQKRGPRRPRKA